VTIGVKIRRHGDANGRLKDNASFDIAMFIPSLS
jgi:hypothetical protein